MKTLRIVLLSLMLSLFPALAFSATYEVTVDESGFTPSNLNILKGDTVTWVNRGSVPHQLFNGLLNSPAYIDSGLLNPGSTFERSFAFPGVYYYYDKTNTSHRGTVTTEGVTISPASSFLLQTQNMNLVILEHVTQAGSKLRIMLDGKVVHDSSEFLTLPDTFTQALEINGTVEPNARYIRIPIELIKYYRGTHTLTAEIYSPSGRILADSAVYEILSVQSSLP